MNDTTSTGSAFFSTLNRISTSAIIFLGAPIFFQSFRTLTSSLLGMNQFRSAATTAHLLLTEEPARALSPPPSCRSLHVRDVQLRLIHSLCIALFSACNVISVLSTAPTRFVTLIIVSSTVAKKTAFSHASAHSFMAWRVSPSKSRIILVIFVSFAVNSCSPARWQIHEHHRVSCRPLSVPIPLRPHSVSRTQRLQTRCRTSRVLRNGQGKIGRITPRREFANSFPSVQQQTKYQQTSK